MTQRYLTYRFRVYLRTSRTVFLRFYSITVDVSLVNLYVLESTKLCPISILVGTAQGRLVLAHVTGCRITKNPMIPLT